MQLFYFRTLIRSCMKSAANISTMKLRKTMNCEIILTFQIYQPPTPPPLHQREFASYPQIQERVCWGDHKGVHRTKAQTVQHYFFQ